ncbi:hypothetical protein [Cytobacillus gottheilii]|uniref:hypothetical protein n=1 Tax=Cytobacillus gottheilii TaxID=859144 RepID=UPI0024945E23|nr:hypothetical protein [Cytobacillus gottheilii]
MANYYICIKQNKFLDKGAIVYPYPHRTDNKGYLDEVFTTDGTDQITLNFNQMNDLLRKINITELTYYKPTAKLAYYWNLFFETGKKFLFINNKNYVKQVKELKFNHYRKQYPVFEEEVLKRIAKIKYETEEIYFQAHETLNISIETMATYFEKLDDDELDEEVNRMIELAFELERLSNSINLKIIEHANKNGIYKSLNNHRLLVNSAIDSLKEINKS